MERQRCAKKPLFPAGRRCKRHHKERAVNARPRLELSRMTIRVPTQKKWFVGVRYARTTYDMTGSRRKHNASNPTMSMTNVAGSGTAAFAPAPEPLPAVCPKWE